MESQYVTIADLDGCPMEGCPLTAGRTTMPAYNFQKQFAPRVGHEVKR